MSNTNSVARSAHDLGAAAWFGGSLMGAVGLNGAAAKVSDPAERAQVAVQGWKRWTPVNVAAIAAHLVGGAVIAKENKARVAGQAGVGTWTAAKTGLTAAALVTTALSGYYGSKVGQAAGRSPVHGATEPASDTDDQTAKAQRTLKWLQWATPLLTGALVIAGARMGEQQRLSEVGSGLLDRVLPD